MIIRWDGTNHNRFHRFLLVLTRCLHAQQRIPVDLYRIAGGTHGANEEMDPDHAGVLVDIGWGNEHVGHQAVRRWAQAIQQSDHPLTMAGYIIGENGNLTPDGREVADAAIGELNVAYPGLNLNAQQFMTAEDLRAYLVNLRNNVDGLTLEIQNCAILDGAAHAQPMPHQPPAVPPADPAPQAVPVPQVTPQAEIVALISAGRRQIILAGPPGTSKTYAAFEVIRHLAGVGPGGNILAALDPYRWSDGNHGTVVWDIVQFHPSYGYEDFIKGIDVGTECGQASFNMNARVFLRMAHAATQHENADRRFILVIDEINRGVLGRIFGELILGLEYRDLPITLQGQVPAGFPQTLRIPGNLIVLGTMNTADRNTALMDHALRRRFSMVRCQPSLALLNAHLADQNVQEDTCATIRAAFLSVLKAFGADDHGHLGATWQGGYDLRDYAVGHTYFMNISNGDGLLVNLRYQLIPLLDEYRGEGILTDASLSIARHSLAAVIGPLPESPNRSVILEWCHG